MGCGSLGSAVAALSGSAGFLGSASITPPSSTTESALNATISGVRFLRIATLGSLSRPSTPVSVCADARTRLPWKSQWSGTTP